MTASETVSKLLLDSRADAVEHARDLARRIAQGEAVDPYDISVGIAAAHLTEDEFVALVKAAEQRADAKRRYIAARDAADERPRILAQMRTAEAEYEEARRKLAQTIAPLRAALHAANELQLGRHAAEQELLRSAPEALQAERRRIDAHLRSLGDQRRDTEEKLQRARAVLVGQEAVAHRDERLHGPEIAKSKAWIEQYLTRLAKIDAESKVAEREADEITQRMLSA